MKNPTDCVSKATRDRMSAFQAQGRLDGAQRRQLDPAEAATILEHLREQMTEIARLDNVLELDKDVNKGQVVSDALGDGIKLTVHFRGSVRSGTFAGLIAPEGAEVSEFIAEFSSEALTLVQSVDLGNGTFATLAALLRPGGSSFVESQTFPEGVPLLV